MRRRWIGRRSPDRRPARSRPACVCSCVSCVVRVPSSVARVNVDARQSDAWHRHMVPPCLSPDSYREAHKNTRRRSGRSHRNPIKEPAKAGVCLCDSYIFWRVPYSILNAVEPNWWSRANEGGPLTEVNVMLDTSIHCSRKEKPAHASRKALSGVAVIGALLLTAAVVNAFIAVADLRARADSSALASNLASVGLPDSRSRGSAAPIQGRPSSVPNVRSASRLAPLMLGDSS